MATLPIVGGSLDGQQADSCPAGYRLTGFTCHRLETFAYVAQGMSYDDALAVYFERTRKREPPRDPWPIMGPTERPRQ
jgi:hypothetical protein